MNKGIKTIIIPGDECADIVRNKYEFDDYKVIIIVSGKQDMKDNIVEVAKARLDT